MGLRRHGALGPSALSRPAWEASGYLGPRPLSAQFRTLHGPPTHWLPFLPDSVRHTIKRLALPSRLPNLAVGVRDEAARQQRPRGSEAARQRGSEAAIQRGSEAVRQRGSEAERQRGSEAARRN